MMWTLSPVFMVNSTSIVCKPFAVAFQSNETPCFALTSSNPSNVQRASLGLEYNKRWESDYEVDVTLRHTHLYLTPVFEDKDYAGEANAITTALWSRLRVPTGLHLWDRPVRGVFEFSASYIPGDQGKVLRTDWLLQGGVGMEIDFSETWVPLLTTTRLTARYTKGENLEGFSIGLGASF